MVPGVVSGLVLAAASALTTTALAVRSGSRSLSSALNLWLATLLLNDADDELLNARVEILNCPR